MKKSTHTVLAIFVAVVSLLVYGLTGLKAFHPSTTNRRDLGVKR